MNRKCNFCGREFKLKSLDDIAEYCKTLCWKKSNGIVDAKDNHYGGGHKTIKRKKDGNIKPRKK